MFAIDDDLLVTGSDKIVSEAELDHDRNLKQLQEPQAENSINLG